MKSNATGRPVRSSLRVLNPWVGSQGLKGLVKRLLPLLVCTAVVVSPCSSLAEPNPDPSAQKGVVNPTRYSTAADLLNQTLNGFTALKAQFKQSVTSAKGQTQSAMGELLILKPGMFRWDYQSPKQSIVSDGNTLWFYDEDLAQVNVKKASQVLANSPAQLLAGQYRWEEHFTAELVSATDPFVIRLKPLANRPSDFKEVTLTLSKKTLVAIAFTDKLNQHTQVELTQVLKSPSLNVSQFKFVPPPGVDVVGDASDAVSSGTSIQSATPLKSQDSVVVKRL